MCTLNVTVNNLVSINGKLKRTLEFLLSHNPHDRTRKIFCIIGRVVLSNKYLDFYTANVIYWKGSALTTLGWEYPLGHGLPHLKKTQKIKSLLSVLRTTTQLYLELLS